jgi:hypothetical protein
MAAEAGSTEAQYILGFDCYDEICGEDEARKWITLAAEGGHAHAQVYLAWMYFCGGLGLSRDFILAFKWLKIGTAHRANLAQRIFCATLELLMARNQKAEGRRLVSEWQRNRTANIQATNWEYRGSGTADVVEVVSDTSSK